MDFGKYKYEKKKRAAHGAHHVRTKEIRLRPKTGEHDIGFKVKQAIGFLVAHNCLFHWVPGDFALKSHGDIH